MTSSPLPRLFLARHGDTAWTDSHQKTGRTDLPLNERGEEHARQIGAQLSRFSFSHVFTSPLQRASRTCALAGFGAGAEVDKLAGDVASVFQRPHHPHDRGPLASSVSAAGRCFYCDPASVGVLGFEHDSPEEPVIRLWNYVTFPRE